MGRMPSARDDRTSYDPANPWGDEPLDDSVVWDYDDDATARFRRPAANAAPPPPPVTAASRVDARTAAVQRALDRALDEWWRRGVLPTNELLRDGLLVLEAGHDLDESQRTLLLRTALARRRGMLTALRYQTDPERTAVLLHEALLDPAWPLEQAELQRLAQNDEQSAQWEPPLAELLRHEIDLGEPAKSVQATAALASLAAASSLPAPTPVQLTDADEAWLEGETVARGGRRWLRAVALLVVLVLAGLGVVWWLQPRDTTMIDVPTGAYTVADFANPGATQEVSLPAFRADRLEVTVKEYRACYERGVCPWPASTASATRANYLLDPAFSDFPMINVDWDSAGRYCRFVGKRLPSAAEWEVTAAFAPATNRMYRYPWGDEFSVQQANSAASGIGDTAQVGSYRPAGDSPLGAADVAGNVAEWTATTVEQDGASAYLVKGGSFADEAPLLQPAAAQAVPARTAADWLGFRCVADAP